MYYTCKCLQDGSIAVSMFEYSSNANAMEEIKQYPIFEVVTKEEYEIE